MTHPCGANRGRATRHATDKWEQRIDYVDKTRRLLLTCHQIIIICGVSWRQGDRRRWWRWWYHAHQQHCRHDGTDALLPTHTQPHYMVLAGGISVDSVISRFCHQLWWFQILMRHLSATLMLFTCHVRDWGRFRLRLCRPAISGKHHHRWQRQRI